MFLFWLVGFFLSSSSEHHKADTDAPGTGADDDLGENKEPQTEAKKLDDWTEVELREFFINKGIPKELHPVSYFDGRAASLIANADMLEVKMMVAWGVAASMFKLLLGQCAFEIAAFIDSH